MASFSKKRGAVGWPRSQAKAILRAAERLGLDLDSHEAQTGTIYLTGCVGADQEDVKIRVADHGVCYCTESISCDPTGCSVQQAIEWLAAKAGVAVPPSILRGWQAAATRRANAEEKAAERRSSRLARVRELLGDADAVAFEGAEGIPTARLPAGSENRKARIKAANAAISAAWTELNGEERHVTGAR